MLVDLGCGNGRDVKVFHDQGFNVVGIDISDENLELAKKTFPECKFEKQDIEDLNFEDESVDAYYMVNVIHYVDMVKAFQEIQRTLKKDGFLFIHFNLSIEDETGTVDYQISESEVMDLVKSFEVVDKKVFERIDLQPIKHTHKILQLILKK
ncbi:MAG: class I SAM-dependent methyltransferase [archaeon]